MRKLTDIEELVIMRIQEECDVDEAGALVLLDNARKALGPRVSFTELLDFII